MKKLLILLILLLIPIVYAVEPEFDCKTLGITLDKCYTQDGIFKAEFSIKGTKTPESHNKVIDIIRGIEYTVDTNQKYKTINGDVVDRGTLPADYKLTNTAGDNYLLEADIGNNSVNSLRIAYTKDDLYEYTHEMEYCYIIAQEKAIIMYGFKTCDILTSTKPVETNKVTAQVTKEVETPEKSNTVYYIVGGVLAGLIIGLFFVLRKRN